MKTGYLLLLLSLSLSFSLVGGAKPENKDVEKTTDSKEVSVDTFENYSADIQLRNRWGCDGDVSGIFIEKDNPFNGTQAIRIDYRQTGKYYGSGYCSLPQIDVTSQKYLSFFYRGTTGISVIQFQSDDSGSQSEYKGLIPSAPYWSVVNIPLDYFSGNKPANLSSLIRIKFFLENKATGSLYLDNIAFSEVPRSGKYEYQVCEPGMGGWEPDIRAFEFRDQLRPPKPGQILFLGSSSIRLWDLENSFPGLDAINRGFGGSHISDSLQFVDRLVFPYRPRQIVFYAGDNDIASGKSPQKVLQDYKKLISRIHEKFPGLPIVYISIKPSISRWEFVDSMRETNRLIQEFSKTDDSLQFLDIDTPMMGKDGKPRSELLSNDGLHLNSEGYTLWTSLLKPYLR